MTIQSDKTTNNSIQEKMGEQERDLDVALPSSSLSVLPRIISFQHLMLQQASQVAPVIHISRRREVLRGAERLV